VLPEPDSVAAHLIKNSVDQCGLIDIGGLPKRRFSTSIGCTIARRAVARSSFATRK
jgi:hypothetical protein